MSSPESSKVTVGASVKRNRDERAGERQRGDGQGRRPGERRASAAGSAGCTGDARRGRGSSCAGRRASLDLRLVAMVPGPFVDDEAYIAGRRAAATGRRRRDRPACAVLRASCGQRSCRILGFERRAHSTAGAIVPKRSARSTAEGGTAGGGCSARRFVGERTFEGREAAGAGQAAQGGGGCTAAQRTSAGQRRSRYRPLAPRGLARARERARRHVALGGTGETTRLVCHADLRQRRRAACRR